MSPFWFLIYQPLGLGSGARDIYGAGADTVAYSVAGPRTQAFVGAGSREVLLVGAGSHAIGAVK